MAGRRIFAALAGCGLALLAANQGWADEPADNPTGASPAAAENKVALASAERQVLERFSDLEKKLLRMAELTAGTDPQRAALLRKAVAQSKQQGIEGQLSQLVELLEADRLSPAVKNEAAVEQDLKKLLELLLSEDRSKRLQSEKERIQKYIQRVSQLIKQQKQLQGEAAAEGDMKQIAERQAKLAEKTQELARDLDVEHQARQPKKLPADGKNSDANGSKSEGDKSPDGKSDDGKSGDKKSDDKKSDDGKSDDKTPGEKKPADGKSGDEKSGTEKPDAEKPDAGKSADGQPSEGGEKKPGHDDDKKPGENKPSEGKPEGDSGSPDGEKPQSGSEQGQGSEKKPGDGQPGGQSNEQKPDDQPPEPQDESQAHKRVAAAQERMRDAEKKLEEAKRDQAIERQEEAKRELELAKAELEAILRQLREEEIGRTLAQLESRFRKMLEMQNQVNAGTKRLDKEPVDQRDHDDEIEAGRLSHQEALIVIEANKALALLHDEGSAVAFPEAVSDLRDDMEQVVVRLAQAKVDAMTQSLEDEIVVALEEMIAAFKKAQKQNAAKPKGGQAGGGDQESPLVDTLAELKMIRSMQMWVNQRTKRFTDLSKTGQAESPDLIAALRRLSEREERVRRVTRDIVVGRNQ